MSEQLPVAITDVAELDRFQRRALIAGVVAFAICVIGAFFQPASFFRAYLAVYQFLLGLALGSMVIVMIHHLTGGAWGFVVQRILEAGMRTLPYLTVLFIPIAFGLSSLYPWARPDEVAVDKDLQHKEIYLNIPFMLGRSFGFLVLWIIFVLLLDTWSRRHDQTRDDRYAWWQQALSGPALIIFGITMTFAAVDWLMSLEPKFHSTIFGPLIATGQIQSAHAVGLVALWWLAPRTPIAQVISPKALSDLGNLLFTFLVVWAYMVWFQFMLIWIANLPYEVLWYLPRSRGGWQWVAYALFVLHFAIPFFLLLFRDLKQHLPTLAKVAALMIVTQLAYNYYLVMPAFPDTTIVEHWMDFLTPIAIGGLWFGCYIHELKRRPILARELEDQAEAMHLKHEDEEAAQRPKEVSHG